jgi:hypothetical protein
VQPFGRRGSGAAAAPAATPTLPPTQAQALPPELVAALLRPPEQEATAQRPKVQKVARSLRGAVLAGLVVGLLNAAANATSFLSFGGLIAQVPLGEARLPFAVMLAAASLWGGARASALALLFAHTFLDRRGQTSYLAYSLAGGAASLAYALVVGAIGLDAGHQSFAIEVLSGMAAGFFYRLFAATERS